MTKPKAVKRLLLLSGPLAFALMLLLLPSELFAFEMKCAVGTLLWMILWWVFPPADYPVIGFLPIALNAVFQMMPMQTVMSQYASSSILLVLSGMIITAAWAVTGLDKRIATAFLHRVGASVRSQMVFWFLLSAMLSSLLPNLVVCATITPIAVAMLRYAGQGNIGESKVASLILLVIPWGATVGGLATPLGSASNLVIIDYIEKITGAEYLYTDWVLRFAPILLTLLVSNLAFLLLICPKGESLPGSKEYLRQVRNSLGKMRSSEIVSLALFFAAAVLSFTRNLYAQYLPGLIPASSFVICAILLFLIPDKAGKPIVTWAAVSKELNWGLLYMFGGALALGELLSGTNTDLAIGTIMGSLGVTNDTVLVFIVLLFTILISDLTSNGATAAICMPIIITMATALDMNPIPLIYVGSIGVSLSYAMPTSIRAIPVGYGLKPNFMMKRGAILSVIVIPLLTLLCRLLMEYWPEFSF